MQQNYYHVNSMAATTISWNNLRIINSLQNFVTGETAEFEDRLPYVCFHGIYRKLTAQVNEFCSIP